ncbi:hypothetical protein J7L84_01730 [Candidatus Bipolaricaulota bacterium]|nr:hypothetical protein [Candidatus Bipolaricaulota bacterium]
MGAEIKALIESNPRYRDLLRTVVDNPYIERHQLAEKLGLSDQELEGLLSPLTEKMVVLELTSQADSSVESRVPKRVYLVNPELEEAVRGLL